jgi:multidrug efflux pump subunit AcrB
MEKIRHSIIELSLKHRQVVVTICALLCLVGVFSLRYMPRQEFPDFKVRQGIVVGVFPGASSNQVDEQLAKPLQNYLFRFKEIDRAKTYSVSREGQTVVYVEVKPEVKEPDVFWAKLRLGLEELKAQELPSQVLVLVGNNEFGDASAILLTITSPKRTYRELEHYMEKLEDDIRRNPAVSNVKHFGLQKEKITVYADPGRMAHYGIKPAMLFGALQLEGMVGYGGAIKDKDMELPIRLPPRYNSEADVAEQIIYSSPNGSIVRVKDIARVVREYDVDDSYVEADGTRALVVSMEMRQGNNIVDFGHDMDRLIAGFKAQNPPDLAIKKVADMPAVVDHSVTHFMRDFGTAIISVIIVIVLLLPRRIAVVAAVTIPICMLQSFGILYALGIELNTVSLATLVVVLGMVVDNAIVVIDNHVEKLDHGVDVWEAAWKSAHELVVPVFSATLAIVAMFLPLPVFNTGQTGDFTKPMPATVAVTLFMSMFVAMLLVPIMSYMFIKTGLHSKTKNGGGTPSLLDRLQNFYNAHLENAMRHPTRTILVGVGSIAVGLALFAVIPQKVLPPLERDQFAVEIYFPEGTSLEKNGEVTKKIAEILRADKRVTGVISFIGTASPRFHTLYAPQIAARNYSQLIVNTDGNESTERLLREYDAECRDAFPGAHVRFKQLSFLSKEAPIEVRISGDSIAEIKAYAQKVRALMAKEKDIIWLRDDYRNPLMSVDLDIDREAANRIGLSRGMIGMATALNRNGMTLGKVWDGDYAKDVVLKYEEAKTYAPDSLQNQYISAPLSPAAVPLRQVAGIKPGFSDGQVVRRNGRLCLTLRADVAFDKLAIPLQSRIAREIDKLETPPSISVEYGGEYQESLESYIPLAKSIAASVFLIFIILLLQFQSVPLALLVMTTMPLALLGSVLGLMLLGFPFGMTTMLGMMALFGTVIRNGVILISYARELEHGGMSLRDAALAAGKRRLRPIFLTAAAAAVGVIPLITSGSLLWGPMGTMLCFGLIGSTVLTLYVLPVAYWKFSGDQDETGLKED